MNKRVSGGADRCLCNLSGLTKQANPCLQLSYPNSGYQSDHAFKTWHDVPTTLAEQSHSLIDLLQACLGQKASIHYSFSLPAPSENQN